MGFKKRKLLLVLQVKATEPQSSALTRNCGASTSSKPKEVPKKPEARRTSAHDYDPLYVDSSGEEDQMKDIQPYPSLSRPASAATVSVTPSDSALTRCFNELLKARNEVSWTIMCLTLPQSPSDRHHEWVRKPG